jgi:hypothetical protein
MSIVQLTNRESMQVFTLLHISNVAQLWLIFMFLLLSLSPKMAPVAEPFQTITLHVENQQMCKKIREIA